MCIISSLWTCIEILSSVGKRWFVCDSFRCRRVTRKTLSELTDWVTLLRYELLLVSSRGVSLIKLLVLFCLTAWRSIRGWKRSVWRHSFWMILGFSGSLIWCTETESVVVFRQRFIQTETMDKRDQAWPIRSKDGQQCVYCQIHVQQERVSIYWTVFWRHICTWKWAKPDKTSFGDVFICRKCSKEYLLFSENVLLDYNICI